MLSKCTRCGVVIEVEPGVPLLCKRCIEEGGAEKKAEPVKNLCCVCGKKTNRIRIASKERLPVCSDRGCEEAVEKEYHRIIMFTRRHKGEARCQVSGCEETEAVEKYLGIDKREYVLCPKHRAQVIWGIKTVQELALEEGC